VFNVHTGSAGCLDDHHLAALLVVTADAVDLSRIRRAHRRAQQAVPLAGHCRQILGKKEDPLGGSSAHQNAGYAFHPYVS